MRRNENPCPLLDLYISLRLYRLQGPQTRKPEVLDFELNRIFPILETHRNLKKNQHSSLLDSLWLLFNR